MSWVFLPGTMRSIQFVHDMNDKMKQGIWKSMWRCGLIVTLVLVAACAASTQPHSSGAIDKSLGAKAFTVTLHLLVNKPTLIQSHFTNVSADYKPTASETTVKQGVANTQTLNRELIEGVNKRFAQAAQRYGAEIQQGIASLPVIDIAVQSAKMVCSDAVCHSFMEMKTDVIDHDGQVRWSYNSRLALSPGALPRDTTAFDVFSEDLLSAMKRYGVIRS